MFWSSHASASSSVALVPTTLTQVSSSSVPTRFSRMVGVVLDDEGLELHGDSIR